MAAYFDSPAPLLPEIIALHGKWRAHKPAVISEDEQLSWLQFTQRTAQLANALVAAGCKPGDRVAVLMSNRIETVEVLFGIMASGCVSVPINLSVTNAAIIGMLEDSGASVLFVSDDQQERLLAEKQSLPACVTLIVCASSANTESEAQPDWLQYHSFRDAQPNHAPNVIIQPDDLLNIIYSSGTTGLPKGIAHSHRGRRDWAYDLAIALRYHGSARTLLTLGLYSNISWVAMLCTVLAGGTLVVHRQFDAGKFLETVEQQQITHTAMVPIQFQRVVEHPDCGQTDLSSMHAMMSCGSPLFADLKKRIFKVFPCGIIELYGLTEGIITTLEPEEAEGRWQSVGKPLVGTDIRIIGSDDKEMPIGESGEIVSRGRITMPGYYNREQSTKDACWLDDEGQRWLRSGDIGVLDEQGFLSVVDRKKDMIVSGGQNIYPQDIEAVVQSHVAVSEVAVIGVSSRTWGETPLALVVPASSNELSESELLSWSNSQLGKQQRLTAVRYITELPRNPNGKILKRELRARFAEQEFE